MNIYGLTTAGDAIARNPRNPSDKAHQIIGYLYRVNRATLEQIAEYVHLTPFETSMIIRRRLKGIVGKE